MKKNTIRRIFSVLVLTMVLTSIVLVAPVNATSAEALNYEYGNRVQARYTDPDVDIALGKGTSSRCGPNNNATPDKAVDGILSMDSFWMTYPATPTSPETITIVLYDYYYFDRWIVKHLNPYNTVGVSSSYRLKMLYKKPSGETEWITIDNVEGNTAGKTDRTLPRQLITNAICIEFLEGCPSDGRVRIAEIGLYNTKGYTPVRGDILTTESSNPDHSAIYYSENVAVEADGASSNGNDEIVLTTTMDKWKTGYDQVTVLRVKDASWEMGRGAGNYAYMRRGSPYNYNFLDYRNIVSFYCNSLCYNAWKYNGVDSVHLDTDILLPGIGPLTVSDLKDDNDTYVAYKKSNGLASSNIVWGN